MPASASKDIHPCIHAHTRNHPHIALSTHMSTYTHTHISAYTHIHTLIQNTTHTHFCASTRFLTHAYATHTHTRTHTEELIGIVCMSCPADEEPAFYRKFVELVWCVYSVRVFVCGWVGSGVGADGWIDGSGCGRAIASVWHLSNKVLAWHLEILCVRGHARNAHTHTHTHTHTHIHCVHTHLGNYSGKCLLTLSLIHI